MSSISTSSYRVEKPPQRLSTCDTCKARHQKCSGEQPRCSNCKLRGIDCSYSGRRTTVSSSSSSRMPVTNKSPSGGGFSPKVPGLSISDADYERLYAEIFGDIARRLHLSRNIPSDPDKDFLQDARPSNASLPQFHSEVFSIVRESVLRDGGDLALSSDANNVIREPILERSLDQIRRILGDSLPARDISFHLLDLFLDYQNSIFYVCNREEARARLALMYDDPALVSVSWFCQMFLIFAVGVKFDNVDDTDGATYYDIGQKYINDAIDEDPQNTIWVIRAMLLLCFYQTPIKWNSVWMHLDTAIRGAQRFQLDVAQNLLREVPDNDYQEWRRLWLTTISFDRWVAIFLGRLPRIKESISRDPIFKDPFSRSELEGYQQNYVTTLAIISGNILRDMYFSTQPSLNLCRHRKSELENWMKMLPKPVLQHLESGSIPESPKDQAEVIFNLHFMYLGAWILVTRPFLLKAVKIKTPSSFGGPISSAVSSEAQVCINYAYRQIQVGTTLLGNSSFASKRSSLPVFFLINAAHIMILAVVWKLKQNGDGQAFPVVYAADNELAAVDASIKALESCGARNPFARRYLVLISELRRQLNVTRSNEPSPGLTSPLFPTPLSSGSATYSDRMVEGIDSRDLNSSTGQNISPILETPRSSFRHESFSSTNPSNPNLENWLSGNSGSLYTGNEEPSFNPTSSAFLNQGDFNFWNEPME